MDFGLTGKKAIVCASSRGLGRGCAMALAGEGVNIVLNGRTEATLKATADEIAGAHDVSVSFVAGDIADEGLRAELLAHAGKIDILVNNAGGPPPGNYTDWGRDEWIAAIDANMLTPIELMKAVLPSMIDAGWGRIVNITSGAVKAPIPVLGLSNGARAGLTGFVAGLSRQVADTGVTINNLLPGPFDTDRIRQTVETVAAKEGKSVDEVLAARKSTNPMKRFGEADEFGAYCAFICSQHMGFVTGQNLLMDGGAYPGTL
jgi:3-oxoacyl-[acyl-carrier protein] reductase